MKNILYLTIALFIASVGNLKAQNWDAATAADLCNVLLEDDGSELGNCMTRNGYYLVNNFDTTDGGFASLFSRNCTVDINGNVQSLSSKGVSSIVVCYNPIEQSKQVVITLFSAPNATKFRQQMLDLGFTKTGTARGKTTYRLEEYELQATEYADKMGRYNIYMFHLSFE